jgi:antitoxin ParD1/3/4
MAVPNRVSRNVSITPKLNQFIGGQIASSRSQSASEIVRAALRLLQAHALPQAAEPRLSLGPGIVTFWRNPAGSER